MSAPAGSSRPPTPTAAARGGAARVRRSPGRRRGADLLARVVRTLHVTRSPTARPLPRVRVSVGPWVPGALPRLLTGAVGLVCASSLVTGPTSWTLAVVGALLLVLRPSGLAAAVYAFALGFALAVSPAVPFAPRSFALLLGVHLMVQLAAFASQCPWLAVVDLRALVPPLRRFLPVQASAQLLALGGAALTSSSVTVVWVPVLAGVGLTVVVWRLLSRMVRPPG